MDPNLKRFLVVFHLVPSRAVEAAGGSLAELRFLLLFPEKEEYYWID
jgi:hypothetical protein